MDKNHKILIRFVLERAERESLAQRVALYRGLAAIIGDPVEEAQLRATADSLEIAQAKLASLQLQFYSETSSNAVDHDGHGPN